MHRIDCSNIKALPESEKVRCIKVEWDQRKMDKIEAVEHPIGAVGLWQSMVKAVQMAEDNEDDIMIICEDDHTFTSAYSKTYLWANMIQANEQGSEVTSHPLYNS